MLTRKYPHYLVTVEATENEERRKKGNYARFIHS
jgi:hypothetical protein